MLKTMLLTDVERSLLQELTTLTPPFLRAFKLNLDILSPGLGISILVIVPPGTVTFPVAELSLGGKFTVCEEFLVWSVLWR